jgi:hypothetical protein
MTKIDHERPQLKYIDNLRREVAKSVSASSSSKKTRVLPAKAAGILAKMEALDLSSQEAQYLEEFVILFNERWEVFGKWLESFAPGKRGTNHAKKMKEIDSKLVQAALKLIAAGVISQQTGRDSALDWINLYVSFLHSIGAIEEREQLTSVVLKQAAEAFADLAIGRVPA